MISEELCDQRVRHIAEEFKSLQSSFVALGDETRIHIILALLESKLAGIRVGELAEKTHMSRPAISHQVKILKDAGIVNMRRIGTKNYYYIDPNESHWKKMSEFTEYVYEMAKDVTSDVNEDVNAV